jgi:hypothetical protein
MRWLIVVGVLAVVGGALVVSREAGVWGEQGSDSRIELPDIDAGDVIGSATSDELKRDLSGSACERLGGLASLLAIETPNPQRFLRRLGREAAGIRTGPRALFDLARGGDDLVPGRGFRARYSDGSDGQVRHFAGIAVAATYGGERTTRLVSIFVRRDELNSADGALTEEGLAFARQIESGELAVAEGGGWIIERLCKPRPEGDSLLP